MNWTLQQAIELCTKIELVCPLAGCHVALTGGLLYKQGERKDCDILFYRIRQSKLDRKSLFNELKALGIVVVADSGWCTKLSYNSQRIDAFFPEEDVVSLKIARNLGY